MQYAPVQLQLRHKIKAQIFGKQLLNQQEEDTLQEIVAMELLELFPPKLDNELIMKALRLYLHIAPNTDSIMGKIIKQII